MNYRKVDVSLIPELLSGAEGQKPKYLKNEILNAEVKEHKANQTNSIIYDANLEFLLSWGKDFEVKNDVVVTYGVKASHNPIMFADDVRLLTKEQVVYELRTTFSKMNEIEEQYKKLKKRYEKEKKRYDELTARRLEFYKQEKTEEIKDINGKLQSKQKQIEIYYAQGKEYKEIAFLTDSNKEYIYKVISNYNKKIGNMKIKAGLTETEKLIVGCREAKMNIKQIVEVANVSRQYVYKVLKKNNISY